MESVKSRVQAISGKVDTPPIYSVTKKMIPIDQNIGHTDQGWIDYYYKDHNRL